MKDNQQYIIQFFQELMTAYFVERNLDQVIAGYAFDATCVGLGSANEVSGIENIRASLSSHIAAHATPFELQILEIKISDIAEGIYVLLATMKIRDALNDQSLDEDVCSTMVIKDFDKSKIAEKTTENLSENVPNKTKETGLKILFNHISIPSDWCAYTRFFAGNQSVKVEGDVWRKVMTFVGRQLSVGVIGVYVEAEISTCFMNTTMLQYLGYENYDDFLKSTQGLFLDCVHMDDRKELLSKIESELDIGNSFEVTFRMRKKDSGYVWFIVNGTRTFEKSQQVCFGVCFDISKQIELSEQIKAKQTRLERQNHELLMYKSLMTCGVFRVKTDENLTYVYGNDEYCKILGYTREEVDWTLKGSMITLIDPKDRVSFLSKIHEAEQSTAKDVISIELRVQTHSGKLKWLQVSGYIFYQDGEYFLDGVVFDISEEKRVKNELSLSEERNRIILALMPNEIWEYDYETRTARRYNYTLQHRGETPAIIYDVPNSLVSKSIIHKDDVESYLRMYSQLLAGEKMVTWTGRYRASSGEYLWECITYRNLLDENNVPVRAIGIFENIDREKKSEKRYEQELQYRAVITHDVVVSYKVNLSRNLVEMDFQKNTDEQAERTITTYDQLYKRGQSMAVNAEENQQFSRLFQKETLLQACERGQTSESLEYRRATTDGRIVWVNTLVNLIREPHSGDIYAFFYVKNIDEKKKLELSLKERAERDALTGLYNKETTEDIITECLQKKHEEHNRCAMLMIDLDNFKSVNDTLGHLYGDKALSDVGEILRLSFEMKYIKGRVGGDEFIVFIDNVLSENWMIQKAEELLGKLKLVYQDGETVAKIFGSMGIVFDNVFESTFKSLYQKADIALYKAKQAGKNCYVVYDGLDNSVYDRNIQRKQPCLARDHLDKSCMMEEIDEGAIVVDMSTYNLLYMNRFARLDTGIGQDDFAGKKCYKVIMGLDEPCPFCIKQISTTIDFHIWECDCPRNGHKYIIKNKRVLWDGRPARLAFFSEIHNSNTLLIKTQEENILLGCVSLLVSNAELSKSVVESLRSLALYYNADRAYVIEIDLEKGISRNTYEWCAENVQSQIDNLQEIPLSYMKRWLDSFAVGTPVLLNDIESLKNEYEDEYRILKAQSIKSLYVVPFIQNEKPVGYLGINNPRAHGGDIRLLDSLVCFLMNEIIRRRLQQKQEFMSYHDPLTSLLNRNSYLKFRNEIHEELLSSLGIVSADVNGLKSINQKFGHKAGDDLMVRISQIFIDGFKGFGKVFRFSGDEFVVLCEDLTYEVFKSAVDKVTVQFETISKDCISIGCTWSDLDIHVERLLDHADELMELAKADYYLRQETHNDGSKEQELKQALESGQFEIFLQPQAEIATGEVVGAEALIRYRHESNKIILPAAFVPILEKEKLIHYIDLYVLEEVCKLQNRWKKEGKTLIPISLNFSRATLLQHDIVDKLCDVCERYDVDSKLIEVEITESLGDIEKEIVADIGRKIKQKNFRIALDDFGSKFTSMAILSIMDFDVLKIDRSMVNHLSTNKSSCVILRKIFEMCRELRITSVAEGVETIEQLEFLKLNGCDMAQGYLFNKPLEIVDFEFRYIR